MCIIPIVSFYKTQIRQLKEAIINGTSEIYCNFKQTPAPSSHYRVKEGYLSKQKSDLFVTISIPQRFSQTQTEICRNDNSDEKANNSSSENSFVSVSFDHLLAQFYF